LAFEYIDDSVFELSEIHGGSANINIYFQFLIKLLKHSNIALCYIKRVKINYFLSIVNL